MRGLVVIASGAWIVFGAGCSDETVVCPAGSGSCPCGDEGVCAPDASWPDGGDPVALPLAEPDLGPDEGPGDVAGDGAAPDPSDEDAGGAEDPGAVAEDAGPEAETIRLLDTWFGCEGPEDCDDGLPCTTDACLSDGSCAWVLAAPSCVIDGVCREAGADHPENPCLRCTPELFFDSWSSKNLEPCDDGDPCTTNDFCFKELCTGGPPPACDDGQFCNGKEGCDPVLGCVQGKPVDPSDGVACTVDACDEATDKSSHVPDHALCDDGLFCNGKELCNPFEGCVTNKGYLDDAFECTVPYCDEDTDEVFFVTEDGPCDDGEPCTLDLCDPEVAAQLPQLADPKKPGCYHQPIQPCGPCDTAVECQDGFFCNGKEVCSPTLGCTWGAPTVVDDGVDCTFDGCSEEDDVVFHIPEDVLCPPGKKCHPQKGCL